MNEDSGLTRISIRLADGEYFPIFRYGDPDTRNISLVPAREGQAEVDVKFFYHPADGSSPKSLGVVKFPDLPSESSGTGGTELQLDAFIGETGLFTVSIRHPESGRIERLEIVLPEQRESYVQENLSRDADLKGDGGGSAGLKSSRRKQWLYGVLFVLAGLALVFWLTTMVTRWGIKDPLPPPVSSSISFDSEFSAV